MPATAMSLILVQEMNMEPSAVTAFYATILVPWTIKPVFAFVSDQVCRSARVLVTLNPA